MVHVWKVGALIDNLSILLSVITLVRCELQQVQRT